MRYIQEQGRVPVKGNYDVVVAGGGVAGVAAALSARRSGRSVLLVEKSVALGGLATIGLINIFVPMCDGRGTKIIQGMAEEFVNLAKENGYDTLPEAWKNGESVGLNEDAPERYATRFSPAIFALALAERVVAEGVHVLLDSIVSRPVMHGGHCEGLIIENKDGRSFYETGVVIDTTGDADVLSRAGIPTVKRLNFFTYVAHAADLKSCDIAVRTNRIDNSVYWTYGGEASLYGDRHPDGIKLFDGTLASDVTEFVLLGQKALLDRLRGQDRFSRDITALPGMAQFRTTRRIAGDYTLTEADKFRHFDDSISAVCDMDARDNVYEAPYRCLIRSGYDNIITAGRCVSADGYAWDVIRVIPPAIVTGQAAGEAAALAVERGQDVCAIDIRMLQGRLEKAGVTLHFNDKKN
ncbi:MAG: FAD-dependent oxidoreductase, partial [Clostridia bacterium]|nr:FAD-dependent oxidoreductase [Clostridia bacterium]